MDMASALSELGATEASLEPDTRDRLDRDGYAPLPGVLSADQLAAIRCRLAELLIAEGNQAGIEVHQEAGADRLADLTNKGSMFQPCFTDPRMLACIVHVLGDFKLSSLNFRAALPGHGHQSLHADWGGPVPPGDYQVCNSIWLLDDFTADNGATRVVPGSHRYGRPASEALADPAAAHPDEVQLIAPGRHRGRLQQPPVARRHPEPQRPAPPRAALLLHPPRQPAAARPEEVHPPGNAAAPEPGGPVHSRRIRMQLSQGGLVAAPEDSAEVLSALRLGWYMAEVRGRNRPGGPVPPAESLPDRQGHVLPLRIERTPEELRIEAQVVLRQLASDLGVATMTVNGQQRNQADSIDQQAKVLAAADPAAGPAAWQALALSIYQLDAHVQDFLAGQSAIQAAAYQLGRGLAEVYWALAPDAACDSLAPDCWVFLLGAQRCNELARLAGRLSGYFNPYCCPALAGTLRLWQSVASDLHWRSGAQHHLYQQLRRWYELLILGQDPSTLIKPYTVFQNWHAPFRALRALWMQLVTAAVSLALVIALITLIVSGSGNAFLKALFGVLGVAGLSAATVQAGLKNTAQSLLTRLRQDAYTNLVAAAIAEVPDKPGARRQDVVMTEEIRKRTLTTVADAAVP